MENEKTPNQITVEVTINAPVEKVWKVWSTAEDVSQWNAPSDDWFTSLVEIDFREQGRFLFRMEAKDKSTGFDHAGIYNEIVTHQLIKYTGHDDRKSTVEFVQDGTATHITETFDADPEIPIAIQEDFCKGVLNNFKKHTESNSAQ